MGYEKMRGAIDFISIVSVFEIDCKRQESIKWIKLKITDHLLWDIVLKNIMRGWVLGFSFLLDKLYHFFLKIRRKLLFELKVELEHKLEMLS